MADHCGRKRRRVAPRKVDVLSSEEEKLMQQAIKNSKIETHRDVNEVGDLQAGPVFYPTVAEFANPMTYIAAIQSEAEAYGICKIVPPSGWSPPCCVDMESSKTFETKRQEIQRLSEGPEFGNGRLFTPAQYQDMAREMSDKWKSSRYQDRDMTAQSLERDYWSIVGNDKIRYSAEYGNDIDCTEYWSGFPLSRRGRALNGTSEESEAKAEPEFGTEEYYRESWWNLNNIPACPGSVLRHVKVPLNGVNVPWLYMGTLFSTFCWHNEDNYLYSINYHHAGSPKQWYGVPGTKKDAEGLEKVFKEFLALKVKEAPDLLHHITTMISPTLLRDNKVPVCKITQHPGEFVVTFPRAFHGGFSMGPNIGEAVNFATPDWIKAGAEANERYRSFARQTVFSHDRLTFTLAQYLDEHSLVSCQLLKQELERVINEENLLRLNLIQNGVEDVSGSVGLQPNNLVQLDEASADYDDKRLCSTCNHICFFSAVGCRCSQSKVSCLRHSHFMCKCPSSQKYMLVWSPIEEMRSVLASVENHCEVLRIKEEDGHCDLPGAATVASAASAAAKNLLMRKQQRNQHVMVNEETEEMVRDRTYHAGYTIPYPAPRAGMEKFPLVSLKKAAAAVKIEEEKKKEVGVKEEEVEE
jgi:histone demethylase JARID1